MRLNILIDQALMDQEGKEAKRPALPQQQLEHPPPSQQRLPQQQPQWPLASADPQYAALRHQQQQQQQLAYQQTQRLAGVAGPPSHASAMAFAQQQPMESLVLDPFAQQQQQPMLPPYAQSAAYAFPPQPYPALTPQQQVYLQQQQQHQQQLAVVAGYLPAQVAPPPPQPHFQPHAGRLPADRPLIKLSLSLIDTYKHINTVYYEERDARRAARAKDKASKGQGANNNGWDDENYDYIVTPGEIFYGRYKMMERIGKGSFGQVVRAEDVETKREVAIKIIKSKKPFLMQAKTEIELLTHLFEKDPNDDHNLVRLLTHFMYRNHQCLVFEMLSLNLYELLKNTQFGGVSLNLIRKFAKQVLKALAFLARTDVDIIHCDLKPENILLKHPKKSAVKVIDFGSSCRSNKRMYSYIQSRFYRSPEVILGLPYSVSIDMWSLGCILVEMHTGEPLFSGSDQFDQMQKIVKLLGMMPESLLDRASSHIKSQFFERTVNAAGKDDWSLRQTKPNPPKADAASSPAAEPKPPIVPSTDPVASLTEVITAGSRQKKKYPPSEAYNSQRNYELFVDLVYKMLAYRSEERIKPLEALEHPFIASGDPVVGAATSSSS